MNDQSPQTPEWDALLAAMRRLQHVIPGSVLVGGTAAAVHAGHRLSLDGDHVLANLRERFEAVLEILEATPGWRTERVQRPVMILGQIDGHLAGVRQLRRPRPLETESLLGLTVPTLEEMARVKGWMLLNRDTTRDYLDTVVLLEKLGEPRVAPAFAPFDSIYERGPRGGPPLVELVECLAAAGPQDRATIELGSYRGVSPPWTQWSYLQGRGRFWASHLAEWLLRPQARHPNILGESNGLVSAPLQALHRTRALWNRTGLDLASDEILAQILDRGSQEDWRALFTLLDGTGPDAQALRARVLAILTRAPTGCPYLWLAALQALGHPIDWSVRPAVDPGEASL
jgi:hypothetical protein